MRLGRKTAKSEPVAGGLQEPRLHSTLLTIIYTLTSTTR